jgi:TetR/AcrR family transcriptional repressor of lmrAB and yxaGH operons
LESQGYHATGLSQILKESGAPKGSLYYYFPGGKEELAAEAIERTGRALAERVRLNLAAEGKPVAAIRHFIERIADGVEASHFRGGGPLATVALETATSSERLNEACRAAYALLQQAFEEKLKEGGYPAAQVAALASFVVAAIEGGIILSRTYHSGDPLREVARHVAVVLAVAAP